MSKSYNKSFKKEGKKGSKKSVKKESKKYVKKGGVPGESKLRASAQTFNPMSKQKEAAKKIQSLTRGRQTRKKLDADRKHRQFMKTFNDTLDPEVYEQIFYETVFGDNIRDRRDSIDDLQRNSRNLMTKQKQFTQNHVEDPRYEQLRIQNTLFKPGNKYFTSQGDYIDLTSDRFLNQSPPQTGMLRQNTERQIRETGLPIYERTNLSLSDTDSRQSLDDWYSQQMTQLNKMDEDIDLKEEEIDKKLMDLSDLEELDLMKCRVIKEQLDAMPMLYHNPRIKYFSDRCRNNQTKIFVDTFFKLNLKLTNPTNMLITDKIKRFPRNKFSEGAKNALIDTLIDQGLLSNPDEMRGIIQTTLDRFDILASYFKLSNGGRNTYQFAHLEGKPRIYTLMDGYQHLNRVLNLFEDSINDPRRKIKYKDPDKIERMKRYFIYALIGLDDPENYIKEVSVHLDKLKEKQFKIVNDIRDSRTSLRILMEMSKTSEEIDPNHPLYQDLRIWPASLERPGEMPIKDTIEYLYEVIEEEFEPNKKLVEKNIKELEYMLDYVEKYVIPDFYHKGGGIKKNINGGVVPLAAAALATKLKVAAMSSPSLAKFIGHYIHKRK